MSFFKLADNTHATSFWALEVAHNFCPLPAGTKVNLLVATPDVRLVTACPGDIIFAFARGHLLNAFEVRAPLSELNLLATIVPAADSSDELEHIAAVQARAIDLCFARIRHPDRAELRTRILDALNSSTKPSNVLNGVARPLEAVFGHELLDGIQW